MSDDARKDATLRFRVDPIQKAELEWAARYEALPLSAWLRRVAMREARRIKAAIEARRQRK